VSRAANGKSFTDFNARYIDGRDPYPWDAVLPLAGMRLARDTIKEPRLGIGSVQDSTGLHVTEVVPGSAADAAGVQAGDLLLSVGGFSADDPAWSAKFRTKYGGSPEGSPLPIVVKRGGQELTLAAKLRYASRVESRVAEDRRASAKARRVREGILRGTTRP
jgi:predicted metalloprotease with PDZ domain